MEENSDDRGGSGRPRRCCEGVSKEAGKYREDEGREEVSRRRGATMALACARLCLLFTESLECGQGRGGKDGGYHVLYRKGVCTRAAVTLLYPFSLSSVPSADRLSPPGPRTNNCPPVNSRYDTREVGALHLFLRRQSAIVEVASL